MAPPAPPPAPASKRPKDSPFYQQKLKAWQPILTPKWVIITFLLIGLPFVGIGFWLKSVSDNVVEYRYQYDGAGTDAKYSSCQMSNKTQYTVCNIIVDVAKEMKGPVFVYYELTNFYQNHRRYVKSKSEDQIQGKVLASGAAGLKDCEPLITREEGSTKTILHPCGLIAQSFFNDTFALASPAASGVTMDETAISWKADRERFKGLSDAEKNRTGYTWINDVYPNVKDITDEHFIVWMRPAALPTFRKLYGRIAATIPAGTNFNFTVNASYPVTSFEGTKALVLSTTSVIGGKNDFLGLAYIVVGFACIALAALFGVRSYFGGRKLGDTTFLVWPN